MIEVEKLTMKVPGFALKGVSLRVPSGAYGVLMGPTGCGKTTILEAVCGLRTPDAGAVRLHGRDVTAAKPGERGIGYVPQDGALFPTMTVGDQLGFAMRIRRWDKAKQKQRTDELAELLGIGHLLPRKPAGLSGGECQRVALGRALAARPSVLCLDEPLSALDEDTRGRMIELLREVQRHEHLTTLHITHSPAEAEALATCVLRLEQGQIVNHEGTKHTKEGGAP